MIDEINRMSPLGGTGYPGASTQSTEYSGPGYSASATVSGPWVVHWSHLLCTAWAEERVAIETRQMLNREPNQKCVTASSMLFGFAWKHFS